MTKHAYRQGFEEGWSTGAANPGSPAAAQCRKGRRLQRYFDRHRVADFQDERVQGRIQKRAMGGFFAVLGSASASFGRSRLGASQSDDRQDHSGADRVLDHASRATALEDIEARIRNGSVQRIPPARTPNANDFSGHTRGNVVLREGPGAGTTTIKTEGRLGQSGRHVDKIGSDGERMRGWSRAVHIGPSAGAGKLTA